MALPPKKSIGFADWRNQRLWPRRSEFAAKFCISVSTLRHWERGDRNPQGPALALLNVVAKEPQAVLRALG